MVFIEDLDPWCSGGVLETINDQLPAILIKNGAHHLGMLLSIDFLVRKNLSNYLFHLDLRSSNKDDTESVRQARLLEIKFIKQWIQENHSNTH